MLLYDIANKILNTGEQVYEKNAKVINYIPSIHLKYENSFYEQPEPKKKAAFQDKKMFAENVQKKGSVNQKDSSVSKQPKERHDDFFK